MRLYREIGPAEQNNVSSFLKCNIPMDDRLSVYNFVWQSVSHLTLTCTDVGRFKKMFINRQINVGGMLELGFNKT